jgi:hypothetical protein
MMNLKPWGNLFWMGILASFFFACGEEIPDSDVADVPLEIELIRTDSLMWECSRALQENDTLDPFQVYLTYLKPQRDFFYQLLGIDQMIARNPMLAGKKLSDAETDSLLAYELVPKLAHPNMYQLLDTIRVAFPYDGSLKASLLPPLKRMSMHFSDLEFPRFRTHVTGYIREADWSMADQVVPMPGYFSLGLHYFLGSDYRYYPPNIAQYQRRRCAPEYLKTQVMHVVAEGMVASEANKGQMPSLVSKMVRAGIKQYFLEKMMPYTSDSLRLLYSSAQMDWANYYEDRIYKELIPHLFSTDFVMHRDYLSDKPYTTQLSLESAPRIGEYCGWKIVRSYMERHPEVSLEALCERTDYETIFKESRYKP